MNLEKTCSLIEQHEGYRQWPYLDTTGNVTIGIGKNLTQLGITTIEKAKMLYPDGMSIEESRGFVEATIKEIDKALSQSNYDDLDEVRQAVLIDMAYEMGIHGLLAFTDTWKSIHAEDWQSASNHMLGSLWAREVPARATEDANMMLTGVWPPYV